jgi:hypothetical protein
MSESTATEEAIAAASLPAAVPGNGSRCRRKRTRSYAINADPDITCYQ